MDILIEGIHTLEEATEVHLSFFSDVRYIKSLTSTKAKIVLIEDKYSHLLPIDTIPLISSNPYLDMAYLSKLFTKGISTSVTNNDISNTVQIAENVVFGKNVTIGEDSIIMAGSYIGDDVCIGSGCVIYPNVSVYRDCKIGDDCILHSGSVIGADGYGFAHTSDGKHIKIYQNGNTIIGNSVEVGANSTIDRATFGSTIIGDGTKIDNLVQIGHNCVIGKDCILVCQVALAGSTTLGDGVTMAGQSGSIGHLTIGDGATIVSKSGVTKDLEGGKWYGGFPAIENRKWLRIQAQIHRLLKR